MEAYEIKKTVKSTVEGHGLEQIASDIFGECDASGDKIVVKFGAMQPLTVWLDGKKLCVEIVTDKNVDNETALKTISKKNAFLERATGYTAKERLKKLKKGDG
jgi:hypothetical protein